MSTCWSSAAASPASPRRAPPARAGARVLLVEQAPHWGGRALVDGDRDRRARRRRLGRRHARRARRDAERQPPRRGPLAAGVYDHGYVLRRGTPGRERGPRERLWRIRARPHRAATGAIERPLAFAGNDLPGVMLASGGARLPRRSGASAPATARVVVTNNDDAYRTAHRAAARPALAVPAVLDARARGDGRAAAGGARARHPRRRGPRRRRGHGRPPRHRRRGLRAGRRGRRRCEEIACDAVAMSGGWSPAVHLWSHCGGKLAWDEARRISPPTRRGRRATATARASCCPPARLPAPSTPPPASRAAHAAGRRAAEELGFAPGDAAAPRRRRRAGGGAGRAGLVDAAGRRAGAARQGLPRLPERREGRPTSSSPPRRATPASSTPSATPRSAWRPTRASSPTSTASPSWPTRSAGPIPRGRHHHLPPALYAGHASARSPARRAGRCSSRRARRRSTPGTTRNGAHWEPVGDWRRPYCYRRPGETRRGGGHPRDPEHARRRSACSTPRRSARSWSRVPTRRVPRPALHRRHVVACRSAAAATG